MDVEWRRGGHWQNRHPPPQTAGMGGVLLWMEGPAPLMPRGCSLSEVQCIVGLLPEDAHPLATGLTPCSRRKALAGPGLS